MKRLVFQQEATQLFGSARVSQLAQSLRLYLPDSLAGDIKLFAYFLKRVIGVHIDAESHSAELLLRAESVLPGLNRSFP